MRGSLDELRETAHSALPHVIVPGLDCEEVLVRHVPLQSAHKHHRVLDIVDKRDVEVHRVPSDVVAIGHILERERKHAAQRGERKHAAQGVSE